MPVSADIKQYVKKLKSRDPELSSKPGTICTLVEMTAADGRRRKIQAADIEGMFRLIQSIPSPMEEGRLTALSFFGERNERKTETLAERLNLCVVALAEKVIIAHARPGSKTFSLGRQCLTGGKPTFTFPHSANQALIDLGAQPIETPGNR